MSEIRVAKRYANALFNEAREDNAVEEVMSDVNDLLTICANSRDLVVSLKNPVVRTEKKLKIITKLFEGKVNKHTFQFLKLLILKNRESVLIESLKQYERKYRVLNGITSATVKSAVELPDTTRENIKKALKTGDVKEVRLENLIDDELIGGFILQYGDRLLDASVASQLKRLKKELAN